MKFHYFPPNYNWKKDILTIPNFLSIIRIGLIPIYLKIILNATSKKEFYLAAAVILFSGVTDFLDGWIARTFNQISHFGKLLDPLADKLTQFALAFSLILYQPKMWSIAVLLVIKELFMLISGWVMLRKNEKLDGAKWFGKASTAVFYLTTFLMLLFPALSGTVLNLLIGVTLFFLALSFILYIREYYFMYLHSKKI